ncbi:MAG: DUF2304 domain-containing protein [Bdellovibrionota bacterium]
MGLKIKILAFLVGVGFFFFILRSIRGNLMRPSYAVLWTGISLFLVSVSVLEPFYHWIAGSVIGIVDARHVIYIVLIGFLLVYVFYLTQKISRMGDQIQVLLSQLAIVEDEVRRKG